MNQIKSLVYHYKFWLVLQLLCLVIGCYVGWGTILRDVQFYCLNEAKGLDALLTFSGTVTKNPLLTPCFWGTISFTFCAGWTVRLLVLKDELRRKQEQRKLMYLLIGSTLFALFNNMPLFYRFYTTPKGTATSCSPGKLMTSPFRTSCFYGFSAFFAATVCAWMGRHFAKNR